ncbi:MAG: tRNA (adenosine(37)-N6)-threonylcarbamoyltransferase complex ATPase subunit type 1 TsaE [Alphaproteobacteria bacterium]|nr:tRNA (adenosine(37)-N6)-threonylcarbamoyltransferase complex ATPase subunit type 1 TsaE [Alphaproteobacteria bacterium]MDE2041569.1 tRNA (adenosine(37)-N6)-threonylcarbamoyltransferase complex ATPase subunit type 1 TsaE [Alphaproteobacteria bacterium]MDE2341258.1 tRNA (adenosine(37)-N6)-threonylcarbamoyltransferase complex ATPase subunit type 1 TsaE [Alphaproteobacteria bacterium]
MILGSAAETESCGAACAKLLRAGDIITLSGALGAGKTTFARGLLRGLGYAGEVVSPSFALVVPYDPPEVGLPVLHVDLYRLGHSEDLTELGLDDGLAQGALIIEWPERLRDGCYPEALAVQFEMIDGQQRRLTASSPPTWKKRWPYPA